MRKELCSRLLHKLGDSSPSWTTTDIARKVFFKDFSPEIFLKKKIKNFFLKIGKNIDSISIISKHNFNKILANN